MQFRPFRIGKYEFVEILGSGGMAEVYRVITRGPSGFEKEFAVKRILTNLISDPSAVKMFEQEARLTSVLTHPNIVQVYDFFGSNEAYFLVMEFVPGKTLGELAQGFKKRGKSLPIDVGCYILSETLKGLAYAHHKKNPKTGDPLNIVHRDISPSNIMVSYEGAVKLFDFGVAKAKEMDSKTQTGTITGKVHYMSPEQAKGERVDLRSDVFSMCVLLFEIVSTRRLYEGESVYATLRLAQECARPQFATDISPTLTQILLKGLAKDPLSRYQSAAELSTALEQYISHSQITPKNLVNLLGGLFPKGQQPTPVAEVSPISPEEAESLATRMDVIKKDLPNIENVTPVFDNLYDDLLSPSSLSQNETSLRSRGPKKEKNQSWIVSIFVVSAVVLPLFAYLWQNRSAAPPAPSTAIVKPTTTETPHCTLMIDTNPTGAQIRLNGANLGISPYSLKSECQNTANLSISMEGYKTLSDKILILEPKQAISLTLQKIPTGNLELTVGTRVKVYLKNIFLHELVPNQIHKYSLEAETAQEFRFELENGKTLAKTYTLGQDSTLKERLLFDPPKAITKPTRRDRKREVASVPMKPPPEKKAAEKIEKSKPPKPAGTGNRLNIYDILINGK